MSKTHKKFVYINERSLSGYKNATINNARKRAIPPDPWDAEKTPCKLTRIPQKIADRYLSKGLIKQIAIKKLIVKTGFTHQQCRKIIEYTYKRNEIELDYKETGNKDFLRKFYRLMSISASDI